MSAIWAIRRRQILQVAFHATVVLGALLGALVDLRSAGSVYGLSHYNPLLRAILLGFLYRTLIEDYTSQRANPATSLQPRDRCAPLPFVDPYRLDCKLRIGLDAHSASVGRAI